MNFYQFYICDYMAHTGHLTHIEDLVYRRLLDQYYLTEKPLPLDVKQIAKLTRLRELQETIREILGEFFQQTEDGWFHIRCAVEIAEVHMKSEKASIAGKASAISRKLRAQNHINERSIISNERSTDVEINPTDVEINPTDVEFPLNQQSKAKQSKALKQEPEGCAPAFEIPDWVPAKDWDDFLEHRKAIKSPMTKRAQVLAIGDLQKACATGEPVSDVIARSIVSGWKTFYPSKTFKASQPVQADYWTACGYRNQTEAVNDGCKPATAHLYANGRQKEAA